MSVVLMVMGSVCSVLLTAKAARVPLLRWVLVPFTGFMSVFLVAGTASAIVSYYALGVPYEVINAGEGMFVWLFFALLIPVIALHVTVVFGSWY